MSERVLGDYRVTWFCFYTIMAICMALAWRKHLWWAFGEAVAGMVYAFAMMIVIAVRKRLRK